MSGDEYKEQYSVPTNPATGKLVGQDQFIDIALRANKFFRSPETEEYVRNFCLKAIKKIGPYPDKFRRILDFCLDNQTRFPSVSEFNHASENLPRRPIDYIAQKPTDSRSYAIACDPCRSTGLQRLLHSVTGREAFGYCSCAIGKDLQTKGTQLVALAEDLRRDGFITVKQYREKERRRL
jgi:hypothetical protein